MNYEQQDYFCYIENFVINNNYMIMKKERKSFYNNFFSQQIHTF